MLRRRCSHLRNFLNNIFRKFILLFNFLTSLLPRTTQIKILNPPLLVHPCNLVYTINISTRKPYTFVESKQMDLCYAFWLEAHFSVIFVKFCIQKTFLMYINIWNCSENTGDDHIGKKESKRNASYCNYFGILYLDFVVHLSNHQIWFILHCKFFPLSFLFISFKIKKHLNYM